MVQNGPSVTGPQIPASILKLPRDFLSFFFSLMDFFFPQGLLFDAAGRILATLLSFCLLFCFIRDSLGWDMVQW